MHVPGGVRPGVEFASERERATALVLVPGDPVVQRRCREHIQVSIAVQVRRMHGNRPVRVGRDRTAHRERATALVLVPGNRVVRV